ncbi:MAG: hypothetical protein IJB67_05245 [Firmicutes bacterium]|nr:hypothetical protein [Bacillota bacterium]
MVIKYDEKNRTYTRLNEQGKAMGTVAENDSLGRYEGIAAEYRAQQNRQAQQSANPSGYDRYKAVAEQYNNAIREAKEQQTEQTVRAMTEQVAAARRQNEEANAQAYAAKRIAEKNIGQQLAAAGLGSGGMSETARLQNELNWQNTVNSNNQNLMSAEQNIINQINQYRADRAMEAAEAEYKQQSELEQMYLQQQEQEAERAYQRERDAVADARYKQESERDLALQLLKLGYNNEQIARTLGVPQATAAVNGAAAQTATRQAAPEQPAKAQAGEATLDNNPTAYLESKYAELFAGANAAEKIWLKNVLYQLEMGELSAEEAAAKLGSL